MLRARFEDAFAREVLPHSLLLHGPRGVGKQRLALWLAQLLLCDRPESTPCGQCRSCRFVLALTHPDLHWYFPRPRLKDSDADLDDVRADYAEAVAERAAAAGLYEPPSGTEGVYVATVRAIVQQAVLSPAIARRKVFIVGDAERLVPQEGREEAANAFLKLLEEPPDDTVVILTSSEAGAFLPTIRSRVVAVNVPPLTDADLQAFVSDAVVGQRLAEDEALPRSTAERVAYAAGAPGRLLASKAWRDALDSARRMLDSATGKPAARYDAAWAQASSRARGSFADTLDALTVVLHERARTAAERGAESAALSASRAIEVVEEAKERVIGNVNPQLLTVHLIRELQELLS